MKATVTITEQPRVVTVRQADIGKLYRFVKGSNYDKAILLRTFTGVVNIVYPQQTWELECGLWLEELPVGSKVVIEQD